MSTKHNGLLLLVVECQDDEASWVETSLPIRPRSCTMALPLLSESSVFETLFNMLTVWKQSSIENDVPFQHPADEDESERNRKWMSTFARGSDEIASARGDRQSHEAFPSWFLPRFTSITSGWTKKTSKGAIPVSILLGIPGSDVNTIARTVADLSSQSNAWRTISIDARSSDMADEDYVRKAIGDQIPAVVDQIYSLERHDTRPRIMLAITGKSSAATPVIVQDFVVLFLKSPIGTVRM